jgi:hypothetical protein
MKAQPSQRRHRHAIAMLVVLAAALAVARPPEAAKTDIRIEYDKAFSFAGLRTWTWHPEGAGDVRLAMSSQDDPKRVAARVDPIIIPTVEREMTARGFGKADDATLRLHYYVLVRINQSAQVAGQFLPAVPEWGVPPFTPSTTALSIFPVGTLIIDITSTTKQTIVWRGAAERDVDLERPDAERRKILERAIHDLISRFPPKK